MNQQEIENIKTPQDLLAYILEYQDVIFVREEIDGKYQAIAIANLPVHLKAKNIMYFLEEGILPVRMKRPSEMTADTETDN